MREYRVVGIHPSFVQAMIPHQMEVLHFLVTSKLSNPYLKTVVLLRRFCFSQIDCDNVCVCVCTNQCTKVCDRELWIFDPYNRRELFEHMKL